MEMAEISTMVMQYAINPLLWLLLLVIVIGMVLTFFKIRKKKRLFYPVVEIVDLGDGKVNFNTDMKAGYFGKTTYLRGLLWSGEEVLKTNFGDTIHYASTVDFQEINGQRGIVVYRDPQRRNVLIPITKVDLKNKDLVAAIAPADYTDVAVDIVRDSVKETTDWKDKLIPLVMWSVTIMFALVSIIVITQMVKNGQTEAKDLLLSAGKEGAEACRSICGQALSAVQSNAAATPGVVAP